MVPSRREIVSELVFRINGEYSIFNVGITHVALYETSFVITYTVKISGRLSVELIIIIGCTTMTTLYQTMLYLVYPNTGLQ